MPPCASLGLAAWSRWASVVGDAAAAFIFIVTSSLLLALPVWEQSLGRQPNHVKHLER
jgi:uncharacterized membrane protein YkgB